MKAVAALRPDQALQLCNLFEPVPLYDVLAQRGFAYWTEQRSPEEWWTTFFRPATPSSERSPAPSPAAESRYSADNSLIVDARGLEPPQPMIKILEALAGLAPGGVLVALTDRPPRFLHAKLDDRGYRYTTEETKHGWCETRIWT